VKTCFVCRKPVPDPPRGAQLKRYGGKGEPMIELRYHVECWRAYIAEKGGDEHAERLWEDRMERWFRRLRQYPRRYS
jgi:hypothetical protein